MIMRFQSCVVRPLNQYVGRLHIGSQTFYNRVRLYLTHDYLGVCTHFIFELGPTQPHASELPALIQVHEITKLDLSFRPNLLDSLFASLTQFLSKFTRLGNLYGFNSISC